MNRRLCCLCCIVWSAIGTVSLAQQTGARESPKPPPTSTATSTPLTRAEQAQEAAVKIVGSSTPIRFPAVVIIDSPSIPVPFTDTLTYGQPVWQITLEGVEFVYPAAASGTPQLPKRMGPYRGTLWLSARSGALVRVHLIREGALPQPNLPSAACCREIMANRGPEVWYGVLAGPPRSTLAKAIDAVRQRAGSVETATEMDVYVVDYSIGDPPRRSRSWSIHARGLDVRDLPGRIRADAEKANPEDLAAFTFMRHVVDDDLCWWLSSMNSPQPDKYAIDSCPKTAEAARRGRPEETPKQK